MRDSLLATRPSGERALRFLTSLTPARLRASKTVVINEACTDVESLEQQDLWEFMYDTGDTLTALDRLCVGNPSLTLRYVVPN